MSRPPGAARPARLPRLRPALPVLCAAVLAVPLWAAPGLADESAVPQDATEQVAEPVAAEPVEQEPVEQEPVEQAPVGQVAAQPEPAPVADAPAGLVSAPDDPALPEPDPGVVRPDLSLAVSGPADGFAGGEGTYTAVVTNAESATGPARGFTVRWQARPGQTIQSVGSPGDAWACALSTEASCTWTGELAPGESAPPVLVVLVHSRRAAGTLTSEVRVSAADDEVHLADNVDRTSTVMARPELRLDLGAPASATPGSTVRVVLSVTNVGRGWASGFTVVGAMPEGLQVGTLSGDGFDCDAALRRCTYTDVLGPGLSAAVALDGVVSPTWSGGPLTSAGRIGDAGPLTTAVTAVQVAAPVRPAQPPAGPAKAAPARPAAPRPATVSPVRRQPAVTPAQRTVLPRTVPPAAPTTTGTPDTLAFAVPGELPFTGPREDSLLVTGFALLLSGVGVSLTVRRRRTA